ncbi:MAG: Ig-like domain-containing protein [Pseudomonadota bacterium]
MKKPPAVILTVALVSAAAFGNERSGEQKGSVGIWIPLGPAPIEAPTGGNNVDNVGTNSPASGAIHAVAPHPTNPDIIYVGSVNGGVWRTGNATALVPQWTQQTDGQLTGSVGDIAFDPTDATRQTLIAGYGRFSAFGGRGGSRSGVIRTTNGGTTWTPLGNVMQGRNIAKVAARGNVLLAASDADDAFSCGPGGGIGLFRSIDTGATWNLVTNELFGSRVAALAEDPTNNAVFYATIIDFNGGCGTGNGVFRSTDTGATWTDITAPIITNVIDSGGSHFELAVAPTGTVFLSVVASGELAGVFRLPAGSGTWQDLGIPETVEGAGTFGVNPGRQGGLHASLAADPTNDNLVYVGGDRQPFGNDETGNFSNPNSVGACSFAGRLFRGDASQSPANVWTPITHDFSDPDGVAATSCNNANGTAPHPDSRDMAFDANGNLLEVDDGGIYRRIAPRSSTGVWVDVNGNMQVTEQHSGNFDRLSAISVSGNQDNGSTRQQALNSVIWRSFGGGDGGDIEIDYLANSGNSVRYASSQNFGGARRLTYDASGNFLGQTQLALTPLAGGAQLEGQFVTPLAVNRVVGGRLVIGGSNSVYESLDQGDTVTELLPTGIQASQGGRRSLAYGASGNADLLFVAASDNQLYRRENSGDSLASVYSSSDGNQLQAVVIDPSDASQVFVLELGRVLRSTDDGDNGTFNNITGNLLTLFSPGSLRSLEFMETPGGDVLAVGTDRGVYLSTSGGGFSDWAQSGTELPNSPVFDLDYDLNANRLAAFTLGRGTFLLQLSGSANQAPIAVNDATTVDAGATTTTLNGGQTSLLANDSDPEGGNLTLQPTPLSGPSSGSVTLNGNGSFSYTHDGSLSSNDSFVYSVCDDGSPQRCSSATVQINVNQGGLVCVSPNLTIPDNSPGGASSTLNIPTGGSLIELQTTVEISHSFVGDLIISLRNESTGTSITLMDRPGIPPSLVGCANDNIDAVFSDSATRPVEDVCDASPAIAGSVSPQEPLTTFNGESAAGNWVLTVSDNAALDTGTLDTWCLQPATAGSGGVLIFEDSFENP